MTFEKAFAARVDLSKRFAEQLGTEIESIAVIDTDEGHAVRVSVYKKYQKRMKRALPPLWLGVDVVIRIVSDTL